MKEMEMKRRSIARRVKRIRRWCALIIMTTLACLNALAQTAASSTSALADGKPQAANVEVKRGVKPALPTSTSQAPKQFTFDGAGVRGGGVESAIYSAGGVNPTAEFCSAELTQRF